MPLISNHAGKATLAELQRAMQLVDPRVLLIPARVLQRVIRFDRRLSTLDLHVPHSGCYFISRERLFDFATRHEYELQLERGLPETLILLPRPEEDELAETSPGAMLRNYWRLLFHVRVHLEYREVGSRNFQTLDPLLERLRRLGPIPFAEARAVLHLEELTLPPASYLAIYTEFAATLLELSYFAPHEIPAYFPALRDPDEVIKMLAEDFDHAALLQATRPEGVPPSESAIDDVIAPARGDGDDRAFWSDEDLRPNAKTYRRLNNKAGRFTRIENLAKAAIVRQKALRAATPAEQVDANRLAQESLTQFATRLAAVLDLPSSRVDELAAALQPVFILADRGFRRLESRLIYDLQMVCTEHQRGVFRVDFFRWLASLGATPLRRSLPLLRAVLVTRHLSNALAKLQIAKLNPHEREALASILENGVRRTRENLRDQVRPMIVQVFHDEGCRPARLVEKIAFNKIVEELLDRVVDHGHLSMGHLRDAFSQSNVKLSDVTHVGELITGDQLLRIDRRLASELDGIYHRGPMYLRLSHRISSLAFGTPFGRVLTRYVAIPFGGSYLILESYQHLLHFLVPHSTSVPRGPASEVAAHGGVPDSSPQTASNLTTISFVFVCGIFIMVLIENAGFRNWCLRRLRRVGHLMLYLIRDVPDLLFKVAWVRRILESPWYVAFINYFFKPLFLTAGLLLLVDRIGHWLPEREIVSEEQLNAVPRLLPNVPTYFWWILVFLAVNLFLNSPVGRYADTLVMDNLRRGWRELRMRVFAAAFRFVVDTFQWMLKALEQIIYTVDELLRFRSGESWITLVIKGMLGAIWSVISYVVRIYITLLIEPQINPIKHFPVVTVSHKLILPFSVQLTRLMATPLEQIGLGGILASTIAATTVFLLPGVFGFLAWELKENWRLYSANRGRYLRSIPIGSHGETMARLLRWGFHSGTIPKLFSKLRRAWHKSQRTGNEILVRKVEEKIHHVAESITMFMEREWVALLRELPEWQAAKLRVDSIRLATNEVEIRVGNESIQGGPLCLIVADLGGWIVARVSSQGWALGMSHAQRASMDAAFQGLFRYCGVDLVWNDLLEGLGILAEPTWYDFNRDGVLIWNSGKFDANVQYKLRDTGATATLSPPPKFVTEPRHEDFATIVFAEQPISWEAWIQSWEQFEQSSSGAASRTAG